MIHIYNWLKSTIKLMFCEENFDSFVFCKTVRHFTSHYSPRKRPLYNYYYIKEMKEIKMVSFWHLTQKINSDKLSDFQLIETACGEFRSEIQARSIFIFNSGMECREGCAEQGWTMLSTPQTLRRCLSVIYRCLYRVYRLHIDYD